MRIILLAAALAGATGVMIGAWTAHGAAGAPGGGGLAFAEIGLKWQMWHAVALLGTAALAAVRPSRLVAAAAAAFAVGIALFSGSLYALALVGGGWYQVLTPVGGTCLILGWVLLAAAALTFRKLSIR